MDHIEIDCEVKFQSTHRESSLPPIVVPMKLGCGYEVDPRFIPSLEEHGMVFSGRHPHQPIMQILELPQDVHPYFIGTQAHPELTSRPLRPQPMFLGLVKAAMEFADRTRQIETADKRG